MNTGKHRKGLGTLAAAIISVSMAAAVASLPSRAYSQSSDTGPTLTTAWPTDLTTLDPLKGSNTPDREVAYNCYQGLVGFTFTQSSDGSYLAQGSKLAPALAASWDLGDSSATFHLRTDAKFYPSGNPVTAADVKWSLTRALADLNAQDLTTNGLQKADDIEIVDPHTVTLHFRDTDGKPIAPTNTTIAIYTEEFIVDSVEALKHATSSDPQGAAWLRSHTAGTGAYYVADHQPGQEVKLAAVPGRDKQPAFKTVIVRIVNDGNIASLLRAGDINFAEYNLSQTDLNTLGSSGLTIASEPAPRITYLALGADAGPFADKNVRQAVAYALPYQDIIDSVYFGRAKRALTFIPDTSSAATDAWGIYKTDPDKALGLLKKAGKPSITVPLNYSSTDKTQEDIALLIQDSLRKVGITVTLTPHTDSEQWDVVNARSQPAKGKAPAAPAAVLFNWGAWTDDPKIPVGYSSTTGGVNNYSLWSDPEVDAINRDWQMKVNSPERDAAYKKAQGIIADAAAIIPISYANRNVVMAHGMTGATFMADPLSFFDLLKPAP